MIRNKSSVEVSDYQSWEISRRKEKSVEKSVCRERGSGGFIKEFDLLTFTHITIWLELSYNYTLKAIRRQ